MRPYLAALLLLGALRVTALAAQDEGPAVGAQAPVVQVPDLNGKPVDLGQYLGKRPVFLEWWATWCEQCEALLPRVRAARAEIGDRVAFFGINVAVNQSPERVRRFLEKTEVPYQTLYDQEGVSTRAYAAPATSYVVIVDRDGRIAYTGTGGDQDFLPALRRVAAP
ncbi:MAG TPA: TlpA disulfide reductase family protein [Gemmatimonadales bacterium]|jgi:peroxiredoxin|nr:TlpA disulfide reductase family protein [Gemmatimonadales bacterium]